MFRHYGSRTVSEGPMLSVELIQRIVERMDSFILQHSHSKTSNNVSLLERCYQMETYRAYLTFRSMLSPDVGRVSKILWIFLVGSHYSN